MTPDREKELREWIAKQIALKKKDLRRPGGGINLAVISAYENVLMWLDGYVE